MFSVSPHIQRIKNKNKRSYPRRELQITPFLCLSWIIGIWLKEQLDKVDYHTDSKQTAGANIENTEQHSALIKLMYSQIS